MKCQRTYEYGCTVQCTVTHTKEPMKVSQDYRLCPICKVYVLCKPIAMGNGTWGFARHVWNHLPKKAQPPSARGRCTGRGRCWCGLPIVSIGHLARHLRDLADADKTIMGHIDEHAATWLPLALESRS